MSHLSNTAEPPLSKQQLETLCIGCQTRPREGDADHCAACLDAFQETCFVRGLAEPLPGQIVARFANAKLALNFLQYIVPHSDQYTITVAIDEPLSWEVRRRMDTDEIHSTCMDCGRYNGEHALGCKHGVFHD